MSAAELDDRLITVRDAQARLSCSRGTIANLVKRGVLTPVNLIGRTVRFRASDVAAIVRGEVQS